MSDVLDELRTQLRDLGAQAPEADAVLRDLVGLRELADAPPAPSPELAALLGRTPASTPVPPRRPRPSGAWARRGGTVGGAVVVLVSSLGATGLSAAANTLPEPLQERVAGFSRSYLPFEFPSVADRREHDPLGSGRHHAERTHADRQASPPAPLVPVRPSDGSEASRQQVPASRSAARPEAVPTGLVGDPGRSPERPRDGGPRGGASPAQGHATGHDEPRGKPGKPRPAHPGTHPGTRPDSPGADPAASPVLSPVLLPVKAPAAAPPAVGEPVIGQPVDETPVLPTRPRHPQRPTLGAPPVTEPPVTEPPVTVAPETDEPVTDEPASEPPVDPPAGEPAPEAPGG